MEWERIIKALSAAGGALAGLLGEWNIMLTLLAVAMSVDYLSGLIVAWCGHSPKSENGGVSSAVGFRGLARKAVIMLVILLATILDKALGTTSMMFQTAAVCYYIANEGISILENAALMGVPFPPKIKAALEELKKNGDKPPEGDAGK
ncbi:MAG: phage holin family protein [Clostridia bacterium]